MTDDILRERLGFDPTTGERHENASGFQVIQKPETDTQGNLIVPKPVQEQFHEHMSGPTRHGATVFEINPARLFFVDSYNNGSIINRTYYAHNPHEKIQEEDDTELPTMFPHDVWPEQASAQLVKLENGEYTFNKLDYYAEQGENISIDFHAMDSGTDTVTVSAALQNRDLQLYFDEWTGLALASFYVLDGNISHGISINKNDLWKAHEEGKLTINSGEDEYEVTHDRNNKGPIMITRRRNGEIMDELKIPWYLKDHEGILTGGDKWGKDVAAKFLNPPLEKYPFASPADPAVDVWKDLQPLETLGIDWQRK